MPVEVDAVRSVEVPTRFVHGAGAIARLGEALRELGVARPLLVTDPGVAAAGLVGPCARAPRRRGRLRRGSPESRHRARRRRSPHLRGDRARRARRSRRRLVDGHREVDRRGRSAWRHDPRLRVGARADRAAHPAAGRRPDDRRNRKRGDALGRDHGSRPQDQVQRRRDTADRRRTLRSSTPSSCSGSRRP